MCNGPLHLADYLSAPEKNNEKILMKTRCLHNTIVKVNITLEMHERKKKKHYAVMFSKSPSVPAQTH